MGNVLEINDRDVLVADQRLDPGTPSLRWDRDGWITVLAPLPGDTDTDVEAISVAPPLQLSLSTTDQAEALQWLEPSSALVGIEELLAKARDQPYQAGRTRDGAKIRSVGV